MGFLIRNRAVDDRERTILLAIDADVFNRW